MIKYDINETGNISLNNNHIVTLSRCQPAIYSQLGRKNIIINNDTLFYTTKVLGAKRCKEKRNKVDDECRKNYRSSVSALYIKIMILKINLMFIVG